MFKRVFILLIFSFFIYDLAAEDRRRKCEWLLIYYMPLDNNIQHYGITAVNQLQKHLKSDDIIITIQADFSDSNGMRRIFLTDNGMIDFQLEEENSGSADQFSNYLSWISTHFNPDKYAFVLFDQSRDGSFLFTDSQPKSSGVRLDTISKAISAFNEKMTGESELIFFQSKNSYTIEQLFEFSNCSNYLLYSENMDLSMAGYYDEILYTINQGTIKSGKELAYQIAKADINSNYNCIDQSKWRGFFTLINSSFNEVSNSGIKVAYDRTGDSALTEFDKIFKQSPQHYHSSLKKYVGDSLLCFYSSDQEHVGSIPGNFKTLLPDFFESSKFDWLSIRKIVPQDYRTIFTRETYIVKD